MKNEIPTRMTTAARAIPIAFELLSELLPAVVVAAVVITGGAWAGGAVGAGPVGNAVRGFVVLVRAACAAGVPASP
jgi:hypothetical protein